MPVAEKEFDAELKRTVRRTSVMRQCFYVVVLLVALAGQVSGAVEALGIPLIWAIPAVGGLELGGIVVLANADVRRRLGERALASRVLSAVIAAGAVAFNWLAHSNHLLGGFFAGMSALGYLVWLMHTENQRRDRLRAKGDLPPTSPAYEVIGHWLRHPWITLRAKNLAKADPGLGLYESLAAARAAVRRERRTSAISKVLHRKIRSAVDPTTADIAVAVYDLDEIATRLASGADYDGLTALIAADLAPARLAADPQAPPDRRERPILATATVEPAATAPAEEPRQLVLPQVSIPEAAATPPPVATSPANITTPATSPISAGAAPGGHRVQPVPVTPAEPMQSVLPPSVRRDIEDVLTRRRQPVSADPAENPAAPGDRAGPTERVTRTERAELTERATPTRRPVPAEEPAAREGSLRSRVHAALDAHVPAGDDRDITKLANFVGDLLRLNDVERLTAATYVTTWKNETGSVGVLNGQRRRPGAGEPNGALAARMNGNGAVTATVPASRTTEPLTETVEISNRELAERYRPIAKELVTRAAKEEERVTATLVRDWIEELVAERERRVWRPSDSWARGVLRDVKADLEEWPHVEEPLDRAGPFR